MFMIVHHVRVLHNCSSSCRDIATTIRAFEPVSLIVKPVMVAPALRTLKAILPPGRHQIYQAVSHGVKAIQKLYLVGRAINHSKNIAKYSVGVKWIPISFKYIPHFLCNQQRWITENLREYRRLGWEASNGISWTISNFETRWMLFEAVNASVIL